MTDRFVRSFFGRVFDNPAKVFDDAISRPETQNRAAFVDGVKPIREAHAPVAKLCFEAGSVQLACPPVKALLLIVADPVRGLAAARLDLPSRLSGLESELARIDSLAYLTDLHGMLGRAPVLRSSAIAGQRSRGTFSRWPHRR